MSTRNDYKRLKEEADIGMVISYLNIPVQKKGVNYFLSCPNPAHNDEHPNNCYYKDGWNNVYCCVCGKSMQALDIIMWSLGCTYGEAADILWEIEGRPDWYYYKGKPQKNKHTFQVSKEELEMIGFYSPGRILKPKQMYEEKRPLNKGEQYDNRYNNEYLLCDVEMCNYRTFLSEKQYAWMVKKKAQESMLKAKEETSFFAFLLKAQKELGIKDQLTGYLYEASKCKLKISQNVYYRAKKAVA